MEEQLITFETAKLAKEKGFNVPCVKIYNTEGELWNAYYSTMKNDNVNPGAKCTAPTQSLLQKWLREVHKISIKVDDFYTDSKLRFDFSVSELGSQDDNPQGVFESYEEALEEGLLEALKLIK